MFAGLVLSSLLVGFLSVWQCAGQPVGGSMEVTQQTTPEAWAAISNYIETSSMQSQIDKVLDVHGCALTSASCTYELIAAKQQLVNGMNYWSKIALCDGSLADIYFYVPFGGSPSLEATEYPALANDPLNMFRIDNIACPAAVRG